MNLSSRSLKTNSLAPAVFEFSNTNSTYSLCYTIIIIMKSYTKYKYKEKLQTTKKLSTQAYRDTIQIWPIMVMR